MISKTPGLPVSASALVFCFISCLWTTDLFKSSGQVQESGVFPAWRLESELGFQKLLEDTLGIL